ncbi:unnamed protein product [Staurois parvus]|uniref:Uncharacterized protein n=1 Tax=Staurois parvus TaxID=386267 RepID=A0ABN9CAM0_9NEOB|nr:unnamed protein product [Staurois parvus]
MTHSGPGSSMQEAVQGPMADYGPWQQHEESAIKRPMLKSPPSSSVGRRLSRVQWQSGGAEAASIEEEEDEG